MVTSGQLLRLGAAAFVLSPGAAAAAENGSCADILAAALPAAPQRALMPADLVRLRDVGPLDPSEQDARLFTMSPDGHSIAFQLRRADPTNNSYCAAMIVMEMGPAAQPRVVDTGDEPIRATIDSRGKAAFPTGIALVITPRWSPNGRWIAFLKRVGGITQVWRAFTNGAASEMLAGSDVDIEDFRIVENGNAIVFVSRPGLALARSAIEREGRTGFHYDDRYSPMSSSRPFPPTPLVRVYSHFDLTNREIRPASAAEANLVGAREDAREEVWTSARSRAGRRAWIDGTQIGTEAGALSAETSDLHTVRCEDAACAGASRPFWSPDGTRVRYFRRDGWARASTAIYEWTPGGGAPRRIYETDDVFADCATHDGELLCFRDSSLQPRRLERLALATGRRQVIFDPNPGFGQLSLGAAERLHLLNSMDYPSVADLVLPVGYQPGRRYPLIVVQYQTRGFLRGGTGDDYPIQAFANRGYAVLSVGRPAFVASGIADPTETGRVNLAGFAERRSTLSTVETGVRLLIERGIADPTRIGITGMSDGATTVEFALLHGDLFAAVAVSHCCFDPTFPARVGPAAARHFYGEGYPRLTDDGEAFWSQMSLARNARRVRTPILVQVADVESMSALVSFTALREVGAPIDMFVFPGEYHVKWQPAHRLAIYERSLDWFDYWLRGIRSSAPERQAELIHWDSLRAREAPRATP